MLSTSEYKELFLQKTKELNLEKYNDDNLIFKLKNIQDDILQKNIYMNITSIKEDDQFMLLHWMDALSVLLFIKDNSKVIDIGTGGGMVPIALALANPTLNITALDSSNKRMNYLQELVDKYMIPNLKVVCSRAEDYIKNKKGQRESFDIVLARAVANLRPLCELCIPYVKVGGSFIAMKGPGVVEELKESKNAIQILGCKYESDNVVTFEYKGEQIEHHNVILKKDKKTDLIYPRNYNQITKFPL